MLGSPGTHVQRDYVNMEYFSCGECCIPAHVHGWGYHLEEDSGKKCQQLVVTSDSAGHGEHDGCNITVLKRALLSTL